MDRRIKHGYYGHPLYKVLDGMKRRCGSPKHSHYHRYGGRGISICKEWLDPKTFIEWALSNGWDKGLTIDRIDNDGNYEPGNCRFVTHTENNQNSSSAKLDKEDIKQLRIISKIGLLSHKDLSLLFGVSRSLVSRILRGERWVNV